MSNQIQNSKWYQHWWGVVALGAAIFFIAAALFVAGLTMWYWWQIRQGRAAEVAPQYPSEFTQSLASSAAKTGAIDRAALETPSAPSLGRPGSPITIVEFIDFKCPNSKIAAPVARRIMAKYGYTARLLVRHLPVESTHPGATRLSEFAWCAGSQGKFWQAYDALFSFSDPISDTPTADELTALGQQAGLDKDKLIDCLASPEPARAVKADYFDAIRFGVRGTPTWFINGEKIEGAIPESAWESYFSRAVPTLPKK